MTSEHDQHHGPRPDAASDRVPGSDPDHEEAPPPPPESLRRELWAILFLYAILAVLPVLIGFATGP